MTDLGERGKTGLMQWGGYVQEAYHSKLQWPAAYGIYDEMRRRDPGIRSVLNALSFLARTAVWYFEPGGERTDDDRRAADDLEAIAGEMSTPLGDAIEDALSCVWFGWSWQEIVYQRRPDGSIGWKKWAERRQSSFERWEFDAEGGVQALVQRPAPDYDELTIPIGKSLHFRGQRDGANPEGWPLAEGVYEPYTFCKNLHIISGIGWEHTLIGVPVFEIESRPDEQDKSKMETVGKALMVGEKQFVSVPAGIKFRLETVHNTSAQTLLEQIKYERRAMMQTLMADWLDFGTGQTGSWALGSDRSQLFLMAIDGTLDRLAEVINGFGVKRLMEYNARRYPDLTGNPVLTHKKVEKPALAQLGSFLQQVGNLFTWTPEDEVWLRHRTGMPSIDVSQIEEEQAKKPAPPPPPEQPNPDEPNPEQANEMRERRAGVELAEPDVDAVRGDLERELAGELEALLRAQMDRIVAAASRNGGLADDDAFWEAEAEVMSGALLPAILTAVSQLGALEAAALQLDWSAAYPQVIAWARSYAFDLVTGLNETTRGVLREALEAWGQMGGDVNALARMLAPTFGAERARAIAGTEITRANAEGAKAAATLVGVDYAITPPSRTNCRCRPVVMALPDGQLVGVWVTANDDKVSIARRIPTPWGTIASDADLHMVIISSGPYLGRRFEEVVAEVRDAGR